MREVIGAAMARSKREIPHYYLGHTVDFEPALRWIEAENLKQPVPERMLYGVLLLKAVALALRDYPELNGYWADGQFRPSESVHLGVAIALACDWRVLGRTAYLYVPEVRIGLNLQWGALPRLITLVGPARAKRICLMCEKMPAAQALDWGLVDELADDGNTVERALGMAEVVLSMPAPTVRMVKEAVNATAGALHTATSFADADQSQLTASFNRAATARTSFRNKKK